MDNLSGKMKMLRPEYVCGRCGCSIPARLIEGADSYIPEGGGLILSPVVGGDEDGFSRCATGV